MLQETAAPDAIDQPRAAPFQHGREDRAHFGFSLGIPVVRRGERREIALARENRGQPHHALLIQRIRVVVHVGPLKRATDLIAQDAVFIRLGLGIEARVEIAVNLFGREYPDGGRQEPVDGAPQVGDRDRVGDGEGSHLFEGVHPGVGAARAGYVHREAFHVGENLFEAALNGGQTGLHLPSVKRAAVVGQFDLDAAHHAGREPGLVTGMPRAHRGHFSI